jgi:hydroxyacylglutathione hydrolase
MKRALKIALLVIVLLIIVVAIPLGSALFGRRSPEDGVETNGIRIVKDGMVSVAVIPVAEREVALIDAGNDKSGKAILAELSRRQLGPEAVTAIFITHGHPDHLGGAGLFPNAQVMALDREAAMVEGREGAHGPITRLMPVSPTGLKVARALQDGEDVSVGQTHIRVFAVPGHTAGSAAYLVNGVLFMGDSADVGRDGQVQGSPWVFSDSQAQNRASLVGLNARLSRAGLEVKAIHFAHSGVLTDGLAPLTGFAKKNP